MLLLFLLCQAIKNPLWLTCAAAYNCKEEPLALCCQLPLTTNCIATRLLALLDLMLSACCICCYKSKSAHLTDSEISSRVIRVRLPYDFIAIIVGGVTTSAALRGWSRPAQHRHLIAVSEVTAVWARLRPPLRPAWPHAGTDVLRVTVPGRKHGLLACNLLPDQLLHSCLVYML